MEIFVYDSPTTRGGSARGSRRDKTQTAGGTLRRRKPVGKVGTLCRQGPVDNIDTAHSTLDKRNARSKGDSTRSRTLGHCRSHKRGASPSHDGRKPHANRRSHNRSRGGHG